MRIKSFTQFPCKRFTDLISRDSFNVVKKNLLSLLCLLSSTYIYAYDFEVDGIYYGYNTTNMTAYVTYETTSYNSYSGDIVIPATVTYNGKTLDVVSIGISAFKGCTSLTSIKIPNSVTSIGSSAFRGCANLSSISIPNSVTSIGRYAFIYCSGLSSISIPNSVTSISSSAFEGCTSLTSIKIPNSVTSIGSSAFKGLCAAIHNPFYVQKNVM